MRKAVDENEHGMKLQDNILLADLDFADDIALLSDSRNGIQELTNNLEEYASQTELRISTEKTKVMSSHDHGNQILVGGQPVEEVNKFTYLGSILSRMKEQKEI